MTEQFHKMVVEKFVSDYEMGATPNPCIECNMYLKFGLLFEKAKELIMAYGTDKVLFGTDYPMWEPEIEFEKFMQIDLTEQEREDILYNNAAKLFNIK
jgi:predicted TIM-barrel fold metal-dependent hydrolase